jgi:hypothetical protein
MGRLRVYRYSVAMPVTPLLIMFSGQTHSETNALDSLHSTVLSFGFVERTFFLGGPSPSGGPSLFGSFRLGASFLSLEPFVGSFVLFRPRFPYKGVSVVIPLTGN